ncbi:MAG TPA: aldo/keto reductase, partial [Candidatus Sulfopaludibacter sp.]|nr:aldo/keto reductase [Candidatus Sulfopaludibacter sp.]
MGGNTIQLGIGLIGIGKPWGHVPRPVPDEGEARALLEFAYELGIRCFDTAPSYGDGVSEERLGGFLKSLTAEQRAGVTAATKMGEHWDRAKDAPYADHSFDALRRSLDRSVERMGAIEILQLHKTTPEALGRDDVARAWAYARSLGIVRYGPSVSDLQSAEMALGTPEFSVMQLPFNRRNAMFEPVLERAAARGMWIAVNRPFAMGAMVDGEAFRFILQQRFSGAILSGTTSRAHLRENWEAFQGALLAAD